MQFTDDFCLDRFLALWKKVLLCIVSGTKEYEEYDYFCNNFKINVHWIHTEKSELVTAPLSLQDCQP